MIRSAYLSLLLFCLAANVTAETQVANATSETQVANATSEAMLNVKTEGKPGLVVVVAIDQLRRDRLDASSPGGLGKILSGRNYVQAQLNHGVTNTCPGHVVMLTGANPSTAGVPGNSFVDQKTYEHRYCVDDQDPTSKLLDGEDHRSPRNIRVTALGDWLKTDSPESRVFSVGGKDRSTIAMGGQKPDGAFWYNKDTGNFTTSGYYANGLPGYLESFNKTAIAGLPATWEHPPSEFREDDYEGESEMFGRVSGHPLNSGEEIFAQVYASPYLDQLTLDAATLVLEEESLGLDGHTDLLTIALSATDIVGHFYGPRSAEAVDALARVDKQLGEFLEKAEAQVGKGKVLVVLSADHGVAELPEYVTNQNKSQCPEPGRLSAYGFLASIYWNTYKEFSFPFSRPDKLVVFGGSSFTVNRDVAAEQDVEPEEVIAWLEDYLETQRIVETAWTQDEIKQGDSDAARLMRNSFVEDRSGDVFAQLKRDCVLKPDGGTTHGSMYDYDRDVPMVFYGWGVKPGEILGRAHTVDIGPTIANHLGIYMPDVLDGRVLSLVE